MYLFNSFSDISLPFSMMILCLFSLNITLLSNKENKYICGMSLIIRKFIA